MPTFDLVVRGGTVCGPGGSGVADVGITGRRIVAVARAGSLGDAAKVIDATGAFVVPGGVDPHVHTSLLLGEFSTLDGFAESTAAAAWGGTTTLVDFAIPQPPGVLSPLACAEQRIEMAAGQAIVDVAFHGCVVKADQMSIRQIPELFGHGLTTLKVFTIYKDLVQLSLEDVRACMKEVAATGGLLLVHAESPHIVEPLRGEFQAAGQTDAYHHALARPPESELDMVRTILELFRLTGCPGYIVHVSTPEAAIEIARARLEGTRVWAETCPHYVFLDDSKYRGEDGDLYICSPPLRPRGLADRLWHLVQNGAFQVWGSDHCCYNSAQKFKYRGDFTKTPNGMPGVEVRAPLLFSEGVMANKISLDQFVALTATNPAKLNGLYPRKGTIAPGADADLAIYDPGWEVELTSTRLHMATDYTPFEGFKVKGWPTTVIAGGRLVVDESRFLGEPGWGEVLQTGKPNLSVS